MTPTSDAERVSPIRVATRVRTCAIWKIPRRRVDQVTRSFTVDKLREIVADLDAAGIAGDVEMTFDDGKYGAPGFRLNHEVEQGDLMTEDIAATEFVAPEVGP